MVKTQCFPHCGPSSVPGLGTEIPHQAAAPCSKEKKKKKKEKKTFKNKNNKERCD